MPTLHGVALSPFVRKVRIALAEKGISYDSDPVLPIGVSDEYKKISPLGKIPCYTPKEGVNIPDSSVIIAYLERTQPNPPLYPSNPEDFARALFLEEYGDSALVAAAGVVFFQRMVGPRFMNQPTDEAAVKTALTETLPPLLAWLDAEIKGKEYFVGGQFTVADIGITSPFVNLMHAGESVESVDAGKYQNLANYVKAMMARPTIATLIEEEKAFFQEAA